MESHTRNSELSKISQGSSGVSAPSTSKATNSAKEGRGYDREHMNRQGYYDLRDKFDRIFSGHSALNPYERHKKLISDYFRHYPSISKKHGRDSSKDKSDRDIIAENHQFVWNEKDEEELTWEKQLAKRYYDKLYKEYGICDLSRYQENKVAIRWRLEKEVVDGKGQFFCACKGCSKESDLRSWEVNFAYMEKSVKKNTLVKLRLCGSCSLKLNFHHQRREILKEPRQKNGKRKRSDKYKSKKMRLESNDQDRSKDIEKRDKDDESTNIWKEPAVIQDLKSREEEYDDYLDDLFM